MPPPSSEIAGYYQIFIKQTFLSVTERDQTPKNIIGSFIYSKLVLDCRVSWEVKLGLVVKMLTTIRGISDEARFGVAT